jgi:anhydro-N-acetylmuramic acid kinase
MSELYVGLLSGTSVDSIDAVLADFSTDTPRLIAALNKSWPQDIRDAILQTRTLPDNQLDTLNDLDRQTGELFASAANELLQHAGLTADKITAIGSHGQTIRHRPEAETPFSLQIGDATLIAELTGIDVVSDFRSADMNAGGQGAPLVPAFHRAVFRSDSKNRVIVNIGGIANITVLPKEHTTAITGFDTGPGNNLMDAWIMQHEQQPYDKDGALAASGKTDVKLLANLLMDNYFRLAPPKSTGFELFNLGWLNRSIDADMNIADVQSTLCDLTATSILRSINQYAANTDEVFVCGGGAHNTELMRRIQSLCKHPVTSTESLGVPPDWVEAMTFAWLAKQNLHNLPGNIPAVTGAVNEKVLGALTHTH